MDVTFFSSSSRSFSFSLRRYLCRKKLRRAKKSVEYLPDDYDEDMGLLPGEVDALRDIMMAVMDYLDDGNGGEDEVKRSVNAEGEPTVVIVVEDEDMDPTDLTLGSLYSNDADWAMCTRSCATRRYRDCLFESLCGTEQRVEEALCYAPGSKCETTVNQYLEKKGYIIVDYNEEEAEDSAEVDKDPDYIPDYEMEDVPDYEIDEDYDEYDLYPDAAENTYGDYYDYGWVDYMNSINGDEDNLYEEEPADTDYNDYLYDSDDLDQEKEEFVFEGCGKRGVKTTDGLLKILGGRIAKQGTWPWQAAVMNRFKETFCGGTLIAPQWVLTAAHCLRKRLYVRLGEHDLQVKDRIELEIRVKESFGYPEYDDDTFEHDIALLKLPRPVTYNKYILPACLPEIDTVPPMRSKCVVSGWGKEKETHIFGSDVLKHVRVPIVTKSACRDAYPDHPITKNQFCAGFKKGSADTCSGDSGGPLVCKDNDDKDIWTIHGVTSFGEGCGDQGKFGVYTKVKNYLKWIKNIIDKNP
uniref:limulus clotting factor C n=1 Tax=Crangon crangon TaxID=491138 RepID=A0A2Z4BW93_CRACN|nr:putative trypsin [Crangon crangon]